MDLSSASTLLSIANVLGGAVFLGVGFLVRMSWDASKKLTNIERTQEDHGKRLAKLEAPSAPRSRARRR